MKQYTEQELLQIANQYMDDLMQASTVRNYLQHIQHFSKRLKQLLDQSHFDHIVAQYQQEKGFFDTREFVAAFSRPDSFAVIWRQTFTQVKGDYVAELVLIEEDTQLVIDHVMVF